MRNFKFYLILGLLCFGIFAEAKVPKKLKGKSFYGTIEMIKGKRKLGEPTYKRIKIYFGGRFFGGLFGRKYPYWRLENNKKNSYGPFKIEDKTYYYKLTFYHLNEKYDRKKFKTPDEKEAWFYINCVKDELENKLMINVTDLLPEKRSKIVDSAYGLKQNDRQRIATEVGFVDAMKIVSNAKGDWIDYHPSGLKAKQKDK